MYILLRPRQFGNDPLGNEKRVLDERDFARFKFEMSFDGMRYIAPAPCRVCLGFTECLNLNLVFGYVEKIADCATLIRTKSFFLFYFCPVEKYL